MSNNNQLVNILQLIRTKNVGPVVYMQMVEQFGSESNALSVIPKLQSRRSKKFEIASRASVEDEIAECEKQGVEIITYLDEYYPPLLKHIYDFPPVLFLKGHKHLLRKSAVAIVGSRNCSLFAQKATFNLAKDLGSKGFLVASGMARGIDSAAHEGALEKGTVAFLGGGVDNIYPPQSKDLYHKLCNQGAVVSEFPIGTQPIPAHFPTRNRLISGMSRGIVVMEASIKSGSIITARLAFEQGREVMCYPSSPGNKSSGANMLIKENQGVLIENIDDILKVLTKEQVLKEKTFSRYTHNKTVELVEQNLSVARKYLKSSLSYNPIHLDVLISSSNLDAQHINIALIELELDGYIERFSSGRVALLKPIDNE